MAHIPNHVSIKSQRKNETKVGVHKLCEQRGGAGLSWIRVSWSFSSVVLDSFVVVLFLFSFFFFSRFFLCILSVSVTLFPPQLLKEQVAKYISGFALAGSSPPCYLLF